jgi:hypothetical protein
MKEQKSYICLLLKINISEMNKIKWAFFLLLTFPIITNAQYYYKDFVGTQQASIDIKQYKKSNIHLVSLKSFESDGTESEGFFCEKKIAKNFKKVSLYTRLGSSGKSLMESYFNEEGLLLKTYDSSEIAVSTNIFEYDNSKKLQKTISYSKSNDDDFINQLTEMHIYHYDENNILSGMTRVKNNADSIEIIFSQDENGNIAIEKDLKSNMVYYYYYDDQKRLTDIVHQNNITNKLVADYIFEYTDANQISKMTTTEPGSDNYFIWKYDYENNLRMLERVFSKDLKLMGKITYEYK